MQFPMAWLIPHPPTLQPPWERPYEFMIMASIILDSPAEQVTPIWDCSYLKTLSIQAAWNVEYWFRAFSYQE